MPKSPYECPICGDFKWQFRDTGVDETDLVCATCDLNLGYCLHFSDLPDLTDRKRLDLIKEALVRVRRSMEEDRDQTHS